MNGGERSRKRLKHSEKSKKETVNEVFHKEQPRYKD
jgi:hypothetical protein